MKVSVIIPAAGSGKRFHENRGTARRAPTAKLYSQLQNQPLIAHSLR
ncbi:MAG: 2-C-methyl-D-erythritol 4-phosphate cytidylyltransferase, partial [Candidatus Omnitrophica bacterium]|nr:2-C-methyl-D-erythritol 4-phosphate cytidylyltransferase [Candidatus Omnitrophota bacterium]